MNASTAPNPSPVEAISFDLLIFGGRLIDPATGVDDYLDVAITGEKIVAIGKRLPRSRARKVCDASGSLVLPGLIDMHAHCYTDVCGPFGLEPEDIGIRAGVCTVVDQGGASPLTIDGFERFIARPSRTRVLSFVSTYLAGGLHGHRYVALYSPDCIDVDAIVRAIDQHPDLIRGIKAHAEEGNYSRWGVGVLRKAKEAGRQSGKPVYIHLGTLWPKRDGAIVDAKQLLDEVLPLMDKGDVLAHPFSRHPSGFVGADGKVHPLVFEALARGVNVDVGRGSHFSFEIARRVIDAGVIPTTVSADLHLYNTVRKMTFDEQGNVTDTAAHLRFEPTFSLHHAMTELLALGVPLEGVLAGVTSNPARVMGLSESIGSLQVGREADVSVVDMESGDFTLTDGAGAVQRATKRFKPNFLVRKGVLHEPDSLLLPQWERKVA